MPSGRNPKADMPIFYVYEHWRPDKGVCFYVGKGSGPRAYRFQHGSRRNRRYQNIVAKLRLLGLKIEVRLHKQRLSEDEAFAEERDRIAFWRDSGVELLNVTDGGGGTAGYSPGEEHRRKISEANRGRVPDAQERERISAGCRASASHKAHLVALAAAKRGVPRTAEEKSRMSASKKGKTPNRVYATPVFSAETRAKLSAARIGKTYSPDHRAAISRGMQAAHERRRIAVAQPSSEI